MLETPGPPLDMTIVLTAGAAPSRCGVHWNAMGTVELAVLARSSGTATVPQRAFAAAVGPQGPNVAVGTASALAGAKSTATVASMPSPVRPIMVRKRTGSRPPPRLPAERCD